MRGGGLIDIDLNRCALAIGEMMTAHVDAVARATIEARRHARYLAGATDLDAVLADIAAEARAKALPTWPGHESVAAGW